MTICRVVRALFALAERAKMDPEYEGPLLQNEKTMKEQVCILDYDLPQTSVLAFIIYLNLKIMKRNVSGADTIEANSINSIFANLLQVPINTKNSNNDLKHIL